MNTDTHPYLAPTVVLARFVACTGAPFRELQGSAQTSEITRRRHELMFMLRNLTTASLSQIGELLGGKDPKTVDYGIDRVAVRAANEPVYRQALSDLKNAIAFPVERSGAQALRVTMALAVLTDPELCDADARTAARVILGGAAQ